MQTGTKKRNLFQKLAIASLISLTFLVMIGAIVRVSGAGLGCPDWPRCWGCIIPPWKKEQVDISKINFERFRKKAVELGRDPSTVTPEHIMESFNPRHTWTEFINRLCSMPVGIFSLALVIASRFQRPSVRAAAILSFLLVLANAVLGSHVVLSGLNAGVLTAHMAMAMLILMLTAYAMWRGTDQPWRLNTTPAGIRKIRIAVIGLLTLLFIEGIMGTQVREVTDELAKSHLNVPREQWAKELELTWVYLIHRSFSWAILIAALWAWRTTKRETNGQPGKPARVVLAIVLMQMVLGVIMSQIKVYASVQVLHVLFSSLLVTFTTLWLCGATRGRK
jgi:heme a synthase